MKWPWEVCLSTPQSIALTEGDRNIPRGAEMPGWQTDYRDNITEISGKQACLFSSGGLKEFAVPWSSDPCNSCTLLTPSPSNGNETIHILDYSAGTESAEGGGGILTRGVQEQKWGLVLYQTLTSLVRKWVSVGSIVGKARTVAEPFPSACLLSFSGFKNHWCKSRCRCCFHHV